jgi:hypothetical protein
MYHVMAPCSCGVDGDCLIAGSGNNLDNFYQNVRGLRTKSVESYNIVCSVDFRIICLMETWINEFFSGHFFFMFFRNVYST